MYLRISTTSNCFDWETRAARFRVGRAANCEINFQGEAATFVSWEHVEFFAEVDDVWYVADLGSSNGTYVDGNRITTPVPLRAGSVIQLGRTGPRIDVLNAGGAAPAAPSMNPYGASIPTANPMMNPAIHPTPTAFNAAGASFAAPAGIAVDTTSGTAAGGGPTARANPSGRGRRRSARAGWVAAISAGAVVTAGVGWFVAFRGDREQESIAIQAGDSPADRRPIPAVDTATPTATSATAGSPRAAAVDEVSRPEPAEPRPQTTTTGPARTTGLPPARVDNGSMENASASASPSRSAAGASTVAAVARADLPKPVSHLRFDGKATDQAGATGEPELKNVLYRDKSLFLNGTPESQSGASVVRIPMGRMQSDAFTVVVRSKAADFAAGHGLLLGMHPSSAAVLQIHRPPLGGLRVELRGENGDVVLQRETTKARLSPNQWFVIACGLDFAEKTGVLYLDGEQIDGFALPDGVKFPAVSTAAWTFTSADSPSAFYGLVGELLVYDRKLSGSEFDSLALHTDIRRAEEAERQARLAAQPSSGSTPASGAVVTTSLATTSPTTTSPAASPSSSQPRKPADQYLANRLAKERAKLAAAHNEYVAVQNTMRFLLAVLNSEPPPLLPLLPGYNDLSRMNPRDPAEGLKIQLALTDLGGRLNQLEKTGKILTDNVAKMQKALNGE
jgi:hypothetical protein